MYARLGRTSGYTSEYEEDCKCVVLEQWKGGGVCRLRKVQCVWIAKRRQVEVVYV